MTVANGPAPMAGSLFSLKITSETSRATTGANVALIASEAPTIMAILAVLSQRYVAAAIRDPRVTPRSAPTKVSLIKYRRKFNLLVAKSRTKIVSV